MEQRIRDRYHDAILYEAMERHGISDGQIKLLDGFESYMYEFSRNGSDYILRIGHSLRRSADLIAGEVDWINYLFEGNAGVCKAIHSNDGNLVEQIPDGSDGYFLATAFVKAKGGPPSNDQWNEALFEEYGRLIGRMHALSTNYVPANQVWKRFEWDDPTMSEAEAWLPASDSGILERYKELHAYLRRLPKSDSSYGLIHQDAHAGNFFVDSDGKITLFDFDDCCYSWYINDIAIVLFYAATGEDDTAGFTAWFMKPFLQGYTKENHLDASWFVQIPFFLKLREIDLYAVIHRSFDVENLEHPWVRSFMEGRRERLAADVPYIDYDWASLSGSM